MTDQAVVLGAGIAGLLAAAVLAEKYPATTGATSTPISATASKRASAPDSPDRFTQPNGPAAEAPGRPVGCSRQNAHRREGGLG